MTLGRRTPHPPSRRRQRVAAGQQQTEAKCRGSAPGSLTPRGPRPAPSPRPARGRHVASTRPGAGTPASPSRPGGLVRAPPTPPLAGEGAGAGPKTLLPSGHRHSSNPRERLRLSEFLQSPARPSAPKPRDPPALRTPSDPPTPCTPPALELLQPPKPPRAPPVPQAPSVFPTPCTPQALCTPPSPPAESFSGPRASPAPRTPSAPPAPRPPRVPPVSAPLLPGRRRPRLGYGLFVFPSPSSSFSL